MSAPRSQPITETSPTPWYAEQDQREGYEWNVHIVEHNRPHMRICFMSNGEQSQANADLIVDAVNNYAALKARVAELEASAVAYNSRNAVIEECAAVAQRWANEAAEFKNEPRCELQHNVCRNLAQAIRNLSSVTSTERGTP